MAAQNGRHAALPAVATEQDDAVTDRQRWLLEAMARLKAVSRETRQKLAKIVKAAVGAADPDNYKHDMSDLAAKGLILSHTGRSGGCWLTPSGFSRSQK